MLFNSFAFLFAFLPIVLGVFWFTGRWLSRRARVAWLVSASLFFYGWWNPKYVLLLVASVTFNYIVGYWLSNTDSGSKRRRKSLLAVGVTTDLAILGYYKYANFFLASIDAVTGRSLGFLDIVLPLGISFFTFTQIAFLVDAYRSEARETDFSNYALFVTYFPHLIAGPVLHHKEMMPQFARISRQFKYEDIAVGLTLFSFGLFKKVVLADSIAPFATSTFEAAKAGVDLTLFEAWGGVLAFTFQIYFDFSGYSDMAVGLARMFGIRFPINFYSPYQARNIIEFWRRWHITLSRFLRDYLYIPLGGSRKGKARRYANLMVTMLLGGLWHGASWTFVIWGGLHGLYLTVNHFWNELIQRRTPEAKQASALHRMLSIALTSFAVVIAWVFFRAETFYAAAAMLRAMFGGNGLSLPEGMASHFRSVIPFGVRFDGMFHNGLAQWQAGTFWLAGLAAITWLAPNTQQIMARFRPTLDGSKQHEADPGWQWYKWFPSPLQAIIQILLILVSIMTMVVGRSSEFIYFQF
ncbi:MAG: MBOAT family protein [Gemmatimonadota bacterium]|nr:MBOAT family protein [Gemmatimonadota bacterium]